MCFQVVRVYSLAWGYCFANKNHCMTTNPIWYLGKIEHQTDNDGDVPTCLKQLFYSSFSIVHVIFCFVIDLCSPNIVALVLGFLMKLKTLVYPNTHVEICVYSGGVWLLFGLDCRCLAARGLRLNTLETEGYKVGYNSCAVPMAHMTPHVNSSTEKCATILFPFHNCFLSPTLYFNET